MLEQVTEEDSSNSTRPKKRLRMLALFLHFSKWGEQVRGDEHGFIEKAIKFQENGVDISAIEMPPSLQRDMGVKAYTSIMIPRQPLRGISGDDRSDRAGSLLAFVRTLATMTITVLRAASTVKYDFIYLHNQDLEDLVPGFVLQLLTRKKLVLVYHLFQNKEKESVWQGFRRRLRERFNPITLIISTATSAIKVLALKRASVVISVSNAVRVDLENHRSRFDILVTGNGVDTTKYRPISQTKLYDGVYLGRLHPQKGIDVLLQAWKIVVAKYPSAKLALVGWEKRGYPEQYMALARKLGLEDNVEFKGFISDHEAVKVVSAAKLFVFPTWYDGFANTVTEALACGVPGVISDIPALRENHSNVCKFAPPGDAEAFAAAVIDLLADDVKRNQLASKARAHASKFRWENVVNIEKDSINAVLG